MSLNIVVDADVAGASQKIQNFARDSRIALTNLSLVVQDLPYGFIGIQNNLPFLVKSFTDLSAASGGAVGALKSMASSLVGPAGLFLAFSAVTSLVTLAVQEYGSLGNAIQVLTARNSLATESQLKFNKALNEGIANTASESAKINILIKSISDLKKPLSERQAAYYELKKIQPDIVRGISEENALTSDSISIINNLAKSRLEYIKLKIQENAISNILNENAGKALILEQKVLNVANNLAAAIEKRKKLEGQVLSAREQETLNVLIEKEKVLTQQLTNVTNEYIQLNNVTQSYLDKLTPLLNNISNYDYANRNLSNTLKETTKSQKELNKELDAEDLALKARYAARKLQEQADKNRLNAMQEEIRLQAELTKQTFKEADRVMAQDAAGFTLGMQKLNEITDELKRYEEKFLETRMYLMNVFFRPLTEAFENLFEKGSFNFQELGKTILSTIKKLAAQIIASGIIQLVASLINPIGAVQAGGPKALDLFSILGNAAKNVLSGAVNRPSFAGVQGGGMNMGGQVSVVLRGQDLIGAINRTNLQIERLG